MCHFLDGSDLTGLNRKTLKKLAMNVLSLITNVRGLMHRNQTLPGIMLPY